MIGKIQTAVIGQDGQAGKLISIISGLPNVELKWVYLPEKDNSIELPLTDDFDRVLECQAVIVASPTYTHAGYLRRLKDFNGYILIEKPIVSSKQETEEFREYPEEWKKRLKVNYNLKYSKIFEILNSLKTDTALGQPIALEIHTSHGLAFSDKYYNSWRSDIKYSFGVLEMVGTHYINLAISLFGPINDFKSYLQWKAKKNNELPPDTASLFFSTEKGPIVKLFHSYAGPYLNRILFIGTNGYFEYDGKTAIIYSPRETYNNKGFFTQAPLLRIYELDEDKNWQDSLVYSLKHFFDIIATRGEFSLNDLEQALMSMEPIFFIRENDVGKNR